jgi:membrane fusion protein (multidrug efflux system)
VWLLAVVFAAVAGALAGCGSSTSKVPAPPPPQVTVVTLHPQRVELIRSYTGRLSAYRDANVLARVAGVLLKRFYDEGTAVKAGQPLFEIDPTPYRATLDAAQAALAQARANAASAHVAAQRDRALIRSGYISRSQLDTDEASERSTAATVKQAEANVESARINLGYTKVTAPIAGIAGEQQVTEGALVGEGSPTLLTTVQQIDPVYVNFEEPAAERQQLAAEIQSGRIARLDSGERQVQLVLPDGRPYGRAGTLDFRAATVDPSTDTVALRGIIPNPDHSLLPGMYVNVRLAVGVVKQAFLIPQAALQRDSSGAPYVDTVGAGDKVVEKHVDTEGARGNDWIVTGGLADGDRLVVAGIQNAHPGERVTAVEATAQKGQTPATTPAPAAAPPSATSGADARR